MWSVVERFNICTPPDQNRLSKSRATSKSSTEPRCVVSRAKVKVIGSCASACVVQVPRATRGSFPGGFPVAECVFGVRWFGTWILWGMVTFSCLERKWCCFVLHHCIIQSQPKKSSLMTMSRLYSKFTTHNKETRNCPNLYTSKTSPKIHPKSSKITFLLKFIHNFTPNKKTYELNPFYCLKSS